MLKSILTLILLVACTISVQGQSIVRQDLLWLRYYNKLKFSDRLSLHTEFEERMYINPYRIHQRLLPRTALSYTTKQNVNINFGFTYFQQYLPHDALETPFLFNELRPHQSVTMSNKLTHFTFKTRLQLEERVIQENNQTWDFIIRERILVQMDIPIIRNEKLNRLEAVVFNELMIQQGDGLRYNFFDQNRMGAGLKSSINQAFQIEAVFFKWYQQRAALVDFFNRNIVRLSLIHTIQL